MGPRFALVVGLLGIIIPLLIGSLLADMTLPIASAIFGAVLLLLALWQLAVHNAFADLSETVTAPAVAAFAATSFALLVAAAWVVRLRAIRRARTLDWPETLLRKEFFRL